MKLIVSRIKVHQDEVTSNYQGKTETKREGEHKQVVIKCIIRAIALGHIILNISFLDFGYSSSFFVLIFNCIVFTEFIFSYVYTFISSF
jgi:hypothetical protein